MQNKIKNQVIKGRFIEKINTKNKNVKEQMETSPQIAMLYMNIEQNQININKYYKCIEADSMRKIIIL